MSDDFLITGTVNLELPYADWTPDPETPLEISKYESCLTDGENPTSDYETIRQAVIDDQDFSARFLPIGNKLSPTQHIPTEKDMRRLLFTTDGFKISGPPQEAQIKRAGVCHVKEKLYVYKKHPVFSKICPVPSQVAVSNYQSVAGSQGLGPQEVVDLVELLIGDADPETSNLFCVTKPNPTKNMKRDLLFEKPSLTNINTYKEFLTAVEKAAGQVSPLANGFKAFIEPTSKSADQVDENTGWAGWVKILVATVASGIIGTGLWFLFMWMKEKKASGESKIEQMSSDLTDPAKRRLKIKGYEVDKARMDPATRNVIEAVEPMIHVSWEQRNGRYNPWVVAPSGWGKEGAADILVLRNPKIEIRQTSNNRILGVQDAKYRGVQEGMIAYVPVESAERQSEKKKNLAFNFDEIQLGVQTDPLHPSNKPVLLQWKDPLANGDMMVIGWTTPLEHIKVFLAVRHDEELGPLLAQRMQVIWAGPRTSRDVVQILQSGPRGQWAKYDYKINDDALELIAKAGHLKREVVDIAETDEWIIEGMPYIEKREGRKITLNQGISVRNALTVYNHVLQDVIRRRGGLNKKSPVTYEDVAATLSGRFTEGLARLREYYPNDADRIETLSSAHVNQPVDSKPTAADTEGVEIDVTADVSDTRINRNELVGAVYRRYGSKMVAVLKLDEGSIETVSDLETRIREVVLGQRKWNELQARIADWKTSRTMTTGAKVGLYLEAVKAEEPVWGRSFDIESAVSRASAFEADVFRDVETKKAAAAEDTTQKEAEQKEMFERILGESLKKGRK